MSAYRLEFKIRPPNPKDSSILTPDTIVTQIFHVLFNGTINASVAQNSSDLDDDRKSYQYN